MIYSNLRYWFLSTVLGSIETENKVVAIIKIILHPSRDICLLLVLVISPLSSESRHYLSSLSRDDDSFFVPLTLFTS